MSAAEDVLSRVSISEVFTALTGTAPRCYGGDRWRGPATWRNGTGFNVSMDDGHGLWHDFVTGEGGGVLDLVIRIRGGSRADALRWAADLAGVSLDDGPPRRISAREYEEAACIRTNAPYFAVAAQAMAEERLEKLPVIDPERRVHTTLLASLWISPEGVYRTWSADQPALAAALVYAGRRHVERRQEKAARELMELWDAKG